MKNLCVGIVNYPGSLKSALFGLDEMFMIANGVIMEQEMALQFESVVIAHDQLKDSAAFSVLILPPSIDNEYYLQPDQEFLFELTQLHSAGCIIASACAGAFILAAGGLLANRACTTHWELGNQFKALYPSAALKTNAILINDGDVITAGGIMSWVDLGLEVIAQLASPQVMRRLGKILLVDTAQREQRFYQQFMPNYQHNDKLVLAAQKHVAEYYADSITIATLAEVACTTERTLLRHFLEVTKLKPSEYLQRYRVQQACNQLESSRRSIDAIAYSVGFQNVNAFRKLFVQVMGLSPSNFRNRFGGL